MNNRTRPTRMTVGARLPPAAFRRVARSRQSTAGSSSGRPNRRLDAPRARSIARPSPASASVAMTEAAAAAPRASLDATNAAGGSDVVPFAFERRRARLDWRLLHAVDVDRMMREGDIDVLESTLVRLALASGRRARRRSPSTQRLLLSNSFVPVVRSTSRIHSPSPSLRPPSIHRASADRPSILSPKNLSTAGDRRVRRRHRGGQPQPDVAQRAEDLTTGAVPSRVPPPRARDPRDAQREAPRGRGRRAEGGARGAREAEGG